MASTQQHRRPIETRPPTAPSTVWQYFFDARFAPVEPVQRDFELARAQFAEEALSATAWRQAADMLDRAYAACAGREDGAVVGELCALVGKYIALAVEQSTLQAARCSAGYDS